MKSFILSIMAGATLMGNVVYQPATTPEFEEQLVYDQANKPIAPLSEALRDLIEGISDQTFTQPFFDKIREKEKAKFSGEYVDHWENGQLKIKAQFIEGEVDGHVHGWFPDGLEAFKAFYYRNKKVGIHLAFYPRGGPKVQEERIGRILSFDFGGKLDQIQRSRYYNGHLKSIMNYRHGVLHGELSLYDSQRQCIRTCKYDAGKLVSTKANTVKTTGK